MPRKTQIQVRRDTAANWTTINPILASGEPGFETDTGKFKIGNGTTAWSALAYQGGSGGGGSVNSIGVTAPITNTGTSSDPIIGITQASLTIAPSQITGTAVVTADSRLSDARTPLSHTHAGSEITSGTVGISYLPTGTTGSTVALGNHVHGNITNTGTLTTAVTLGATPKFVITDSSTNVIGTYTPTGTASATTYLSGTGVWSTPAGGGGSLGWLGTTQTTASSGGTSSLTGVNTFTGATSGNIVMSTATVSGSGTQTSTNTTLTTGNATGGLGAGGTVTSGNLTIKTGDATSDLTGIEGSTSNPGNIYIATGTPVYEPETGGANRGKVYVGTGSTGEVIIGNPNGTLSGANIVRIMPADTSGTDKTVAIVENGRDHTVTVGNGSTSTIVKLGVNATTSRVELGNNNTSSATYHNGKNFFWQPDPPAVTSGSLLTVANLQTWMLTTVSTSGSLQLPTGTNMDTISSFTINIAFEWSLINTAGSGSVSITANGTGHTVYGNMAVASNTTGRFRSRRTGVTTWVTYRIG